MKFLFDFFPVLLFFVAYKLYGFYVGTAVAVAATILQVALFWLRHRRFENSHLVVLAIVVLFGGATLIFDDPVFFKWKPTVAYWLFAIGFLGSQFIGQRSFTERMMSQALSAPRHVWTRLNLAWVVFFALMGIVNLYVAYNYPEDTWVNFKLFGIMGITLAFVLGQGVFIARYLDDDEAGGEEKS
ncbi:septation protein A [Thiohalobacter sp. IOR34]|uniref:septation protein A n=1 Tax=Thiohalobacter sp. IOR34 TaxID=3057176 RepID=UPI0025AFCE8C|nr:septation protein A [Thiohalobacter sp. IOR34]WJW76646.1 septation protein A [Thiohalobacter sp. IOR34]